MKRTYLLGLLLALALPLGVAPTARTVEPLNALSDTDATELAAPDSAVVDEPVEPRDDTFSGLSALSAPDRPRLASVIQSSANNWHIETVDSEGVRGATSLVLDNAGHPHISYSEFDGYSVGSLKYAWHDGADWHIETVDSGEWLYAAPSLTLDGAGHPHISYSEFDDYPVSSLKYAWHDGTDWHIETVDIVEHWGSSLALDKTGHPHIGYVHHDYPVSNLKYAWYDGEDWHIETIDSGEEKDFGSTSLALDSAGHPYISYTDGNDLKYAWCDGANWYIETIDTIVIEGPMIGQIPGSVGAPSLALDGDTRPHIGYISSIMNSFPPIYDIRLKYACYGGTSWHIETVDSEANVNGNPSLALDGTGHPHISYLDSNDDLKYVQHGGTSWHVETVDSGEDVGGDPSLALDEAGHPHISYYDQINSDLKYAQQLFSLNKQVVSSDSLDNVSVLSHILTYTLTIWGPPGQNFHLWDLLSDAVHYIPGSITGTFTPPAVYSSTRDAIIWQGMLLTDTVQTVRFRVTADVGGVGSLPVPITNTAWLTNTDSGAVVSATSRTNVLPPPFSLRKQAAPSDNLRSNEPLTYTLTISGPGLNVRLWDPLPPSVSYIPDSITDTVSRISGTLVRPAAMYSPTAHAVMWQGTVPTDTAQVIRFQVTAGVSGTGSLSLSQPIVNTAWLTATESGRSVLSTVIVNGYYLYLPLILRQPQ